MIVYIILTLAHVVGSCPCTSWTQVRSQPVVQASTASWNWAADADGKPSEAIVIENNGVWDRTDRALPSGASCTESHTITLDRTKAEKAARAGSFVLEIGTIGPAVQVSQLKAHPKPVEIEYESVPVEVR